MAVGAKIELTTPVEELSGVGSRYAEKLRHLGMETLKDLLLYFPRRYDDFSQLERIGSLRNGEQVTIRGELIDLVGRRSPRKRVFITEGLLADESGAIRLVWFNQPFLTKTLQKGDNLSISGKAEYAQSGGMQIVSSAYEKISGTPTHTGGLVPVYGETEGLSSKWLRSLIKRHLNYTKQLVDPLPPALRQQYSLVQLSSAVEDLHFPQTSEELEKAQRRLSFGELLNLQLRTLFIKKQNEQFRAPAINFNKEYVDSFINELEYTMTDGQRKVAWQALQGMERSVPMNRLLEGDVGSGKTTVAALLLSHVALHGYQGVLMVPSNLLAIQHYANLKLVLDKLKLQTVLFTSKRVEVDEVLGSAKEARELIAQGKVQIIIGTQSLLRDVQFANLGLIVVDEQHRFGVEQRAKLRRENEKQMPHLLSMTATPIPRTLALTAYGDLDLSVLREIPGDRPKIKTDWFTKSQRSNAYDHIKEEIRSGRQVFVVCPLIEESDALGVRSATEVHENLTKEIFPDLKIGLVHGRLKPADRDLVMEEFASGKLNILVATSVIEVGIDIPNATIMVIEGAERFGLAQLHQIRGRVGRGDYPGHCYIFTESEGETIEARIKALIQSSDGFELAERDLELRGPGELLGTRQSGQDLRVASLLDAPLIAQTQKAAQELAASDPELNSLPLLKEEVMASIRSYHPE